MNKVVLATRKYKVGYEVRDELCRTDFSGGEILNQGDADVGELEELIEFITTPQDVIVKSAYTPSGDYIGDKRTAHFLCSKRGIKPEKRTPESKVCSIGFSERDGKWYGWSHRAIYGFKVGDVVKKGDCTNSSGYTDAYLSEHPEEDGSLPVGFTAKTLEDARVMAVAFAESVS